MNYTLSNKEQEVLTKYLTVLKDLESKHKEVAEKIRFILEILAQLNNLSGNSVFNFDTMTFETKNLGSSEL